jgi:hypothetical protein
MPAISTIPPALSLIGPYTSMADPVAMVLNIPRASTAMPYVHGLKVKTNIYAS